MRSKGKSAGIVTLILDAVKGIIPILYGLRHFDSPVLLVSGGAAVILGHLFPLYLKFKGGKGIASFLGVLLVFHFPSAAAFGAAFLVTFYFCRYVSAGSIAGVNAAFFIILFTQVPDVSMIVFSIVVLITIKHRANIKRIIDGTENQLIWKKNG